MINDKKQTHIRITAMLMALLLIFCFFSVAPISLAHAASGDYKITLRGNGGSPTTKILGALKEDWWTLTAAEVASYTPTREGYNFVGWYTHATLGYKVTFPFVVDDIYNLYARWEAIPVTTYTVTFQWYISFNPLDPPAITIATTQTLNQGVQIVAPTNWQSYIPAAGHTFLGWSTTAPAGPIHDGPVNVSSFPIATQNITYYAVWGPVSYTITWDARGGVFN